MGACESTIGNNKEDLYDYRQVYNFSELENDEKEKVVSLIKERVEKYSKDEFITCQKHIVLPKFVKVNPGRYFVLGYVHFKKLVKGVDCWHFRDPISIWTSRYVDNSELYSILESEILKQNKNETFTISIDTQLLYYQEYKDESEQKTARFGYLPDVYRKCDTGYHAIKITLRKVFNTMEQS